MLPSPPFAAGPIKVVLPDRVAHLSDEDRQSLANLPPVFAEHGAALTRELGATFEFVPHDPGEGPRWLIGPASCHDAIARYRPGAEQPELFLDRAAQPLITDGPTPADVWSTFSWLRSLARFPGGAWQVGDCPDLAAAVHRIEEEVGDSYPSFGLRGIDWAALCAAHCDSVLRASDPMVAMQEWLAGLQDTHTWVRSVEPRGELPYDLWLSEDAAAIGTVPRLSAAWHAGVRPGFRLIGHDVRSWWRRTAATPHARPWVAGRRLMSGRVGEAREWIAQSPAGDCVRWTESFPATRWRDVARSSRLPSGTGYLRIHAWRDRPALETVINAAFADFRSTGRLIVDLRGNGGGDIVLAQEFRNRFLRRPTVLGTVRYSVGHARLSDPADIVGEPAPENLRWFGRVRFLTDALTYSASEDALLGLQGLEHVEVVGEPSGGGSGRPRVLPLLSGWRLTVSTALTFDRNGRCVENAGIALDRPVAVDRIRDTDNDVVLAAAEKDW